MLTATKIIEDKLIVDSDFVECLFRNLDGVIDVRVKNEVDEATKKLYFDSIEELKAYQPPADKSVYIGLCTRKNKKSGSRPNCKTTTVLWADYDQGLTLQEVKARIAFDAGFPEPTIIVRSGRENGFHVYWQLDQRISGELAEPVIKELARLTGGDPKVVGYQSVLRLPGTLNNKYQHRPACEIIELNADNVYNFESLATTLKLPTPNSNETTITAKGTLHIPELHTSKYSCIRKIADGVPRGHRNFGLGRIISHLKLNGTSYHGALEIVKAWNKNNSPSKNENELTSEFFYFWNGRYRYDGSQFSSPHLEEINKVYCGDDCAHRHDKNHFTQSNGSEPEIDNFLFKNTIYPEIGALELACYIFLIREESLTRKRLSELVNRNIENQNFRKAINNLKKRDLIDIKAAVPQKGISEKITFKKLSNYGRGFTPFPMAVVKVYAHKGLSDNAFKLLCLIKHHIYHQKDRHPTNDELATLLGIPERSVTSLLSLLEKEGYLKRLLTKQDNGKTSRLIDIQF